MTTRTLVVHAGGLGDFLLFCPALTQLAQDGSVELLGRPERLELAVTAGLAEAAHDIDCASVRFDTAFSYPDDRLRGFLSRFGRVIVWMKDDGTLRKAILSCGVSDVQTFPGIPPDGWTRHASEYYADCLGFDAQTPFLLAMPGAGVPRDVIVHPGSGGTRKNWPTDRFEAVARSLEERGRRVTWCVGPAEHDMRVPANADLLAADRLVDLARELTAARLYIGNDSGITHLAAATGCPTVAIFGPTDPSVWAPRGDHVTLAHGTPWPSVGEVLEAMRKMDE